MLADSTIKFILPITWPCIVLTSTRHEPVGVP